MEDFKELMKLKLTELQEKAEKEGVKFQENDTKSMLANAILAIRVSKAKMNVAGSAKVNKKKVADAKKRLEQQTEARKIAEAEAAKLKVAASPSDPQVKTPEGEKEVGKTGYRYNSKATNLFDCWEKI